jgi:hypothetical protein
VTFPVKARVWISLYIKPEKHSKNSLNPVESIVDKFGLFALTGQETKASRVDNNYPAKPQDVPEGATQTGKVMC